MMRPPADEQEPEVEPNEPESLLADLAMQISQRLEAGEPVRSEDYATRYPACVGPIRRLLPTLHSLVALGQKAGRKPEPREIESRHEKSNDHEP